MSDENLEQIQNNVDLFRLLQQKILTCGRPFGILDPTDELTEHGRGYGTGQKPQDYLEEFAEFLRANQNEIVSFNIVCTCPKDLTRADLKSLCLSFEVAGFTLPKLNTISNSYLNSIYRNVRTLQALI